MLSLVDITLHMLDLTDDRSREIIANINQPELSVKLLKHLYSARTDRKQFIKSLRLNLADEMYLKINLPKERKDDLWSRLHYCGSSITESTFENITLKGSIKSNHKLLSDDYYSLEFLQHFEQLWKADKALRKIEWTLLCIGYFTHHRNLLFKLDRDMVELILNDKTKLIDIIVTDIFNADIAEVLLNKIKRDIPDHSKELEKWYKLDSNHCLIILADTYDNTYDGYNNKLLMERFITRIKSVSHLTSEFKNLI